LQLILPSTVVDPDFCGHIKLFDNVFISDLRPMRPNGRLGLYMRIYVNAKYKDMHICNKIVSKFRKTKQMYTI